MTIRSMTGFGSAQGSIGAHSWSWDIRSVNAKGLDLRLRIPDWLDGLEVDLRSILSKNLARGNVSLSLRLSRNENGGTLVRVNSAMLKSVLDAMAVAEDAAQTAGVSLAPSTPADVLSIRGVLEQSAGEDDPSPIVAALKDQFGEILVEFVQMREREGQELLRILTDQLEKVSALCMAAATHAEARKPKVAEALKANLARVLEASDGVDTDRVAQELALMAVKSDVTEEIDRLGAHVAAARDLLEKGGAVGRKLDFLMQEFNREANTLCSKAQDSDLTATGLELKSLIDQMREQVQNIE